MQVRPAPTVRRLPRPLPGSFVSLLGPARAICPIVQPGKLDLRPRPGGRISTSSISQVKGKFIGELIRERGTGVVGRSPFSFLGMRRRREGWVEAGTGLPGVGSRARGLVSKCTIEVEVLGFEE